MLNIASVNVPKIKPETKVLIIKTLKSKSPAEVADVSMCLNGRWRGFASITKILAMSMTDPGRAGPRKTTAQDDSLLVWLSKAMPMSTASQLQEEWTPAMPVSSRTVRRILSCNGLHGYIAA